MGFFDFGTPRDMLDKAKRELKRLENAAPPDETPSDDFKDHVFNFFVTAYHVADYMDEALKAEALKDDLLLRRGDASNKAKHMELNPQKQRKKNKRPDPKTPKDYYVTLGGPPSRDFVKWNVQWPDGTRLEVVSFARDVIAKWEAFFASHGV
jgi:hypothetical protein